MGELQKRKINSGDSLQIPVSEAPVMRESVSTPVTTEISDTMHKTETETILPKKSMEAEPIELSVEFASAPIHIDAHLVTEFDNTLAQLKRNAQVCKTTSLDRLPETPHASMLKNVYAKFIQYADIRQADSSCAQIADIAKQAGTALRECIDKKDLFEEEHRSILLSLQGLSAAGVNRRKRKMNRIKGISLYLTLLDEMESFLNFIINDNYTGTLDTTGAHTFADSEITMNPDNGRTISGSDYTISYSYKDVSQPLFHRPPKVEDVRQGRLGDCYLLAGLASIVATDPSLITQSMKDLGDYVCVQFHKEPYGPDDIEKVTVKKSVPTSTVRFTATGNEAELGDPFAKDCLWVQMIEKAYTASGLRTSIWNNAGKEYHNISGGLSQVFISQMTGKKWTVRRMASNGLLDKRNSLIGVYDDMAKAGGSAYMSAFDFRIKKKILSYNRGNAIDTDKLISAAKAVYGQLQARGISIEDAVDIAVKMDDKEKKHLKITPDGETIQVKATMLTDLYEILKNSSLTVPSGHMIGEAFIAEAAVSLGITKQVFGDGFIGDLFEQKTQAGTPQQEQMAADIKLKYGQEGRFISEDDSLRMAEECERRLDRLAESRGITLHEVQEGFNGDIFDQKTKSGTPGQEQLAARIRQTYTDRNMFIGQDDALTLAIAYEEAYKHAIAEAMIRKLKASEDMALAYSLFFSRTGKHGKKKRYTREAKEIYKEIENAISRGAIVTTGSVSFHRRGDSSKQAGVVESHAYSVLGTWEANGARFIRLRNPWGHYTRKYERTTPKAEEKTGRGAGTFIMELNDFISMYREYRINE